MREFNSPSDLKNQSKLLVTRNDRKIVFTLIVNRKLRVVINQHDNYGICN